MSSKEKRTAQLLQGALDLIVPRTLETMAPQHAYQIAARFEQVSDRLPELSQGMPYPALVRLEQCGWIKGCWGKTLNNREAKFYTVIRAGRKALAEETMRWRTIPDLVERLLVEGALP